MKHFSFTNPLWQWILLAIVILFCGTVLRFYNLTNIPNGLTWDEVAIGYSGWSVWETRRDEWLQLLPISFRSYGDYKAPFAVYLVGLFTQIFGLNAFAIRFPFALIGSISIAIMGWLTYEWIRYYFLTRNDTNSALVEGQKKLPITYFGYVVLAMTLLAFSPWHLHFSRAGFESGIALGMVMFGIASWYRMLNSKQNLWLFVSVLAFSGSLYTYHSTKIVVPLIGILFAFTAWKYVLKSYKWFISAFLFGIALLSPLAYDSFFRQGATRLTQTSIFSIDGSLADKLVLFVSQYIEHLTPSFLVLGEVVNYRQGMGDWGVLLPIPFILVVSSVLLLLNTVVRSLLSKSIKNSAHVANPSATMVSLLIGWILILISLIPGGLGLDEVPHTIRSLLALPGFILICVVTTKYILESVYSSKINKTILGSHNEKNVTLKAILGIGILLHALSILSMIHSYFVSFPVKSSQLYISEYTNAMKIAHQYATGTGKPEKDKILISGEYGQPHMYTLFANQIHPFAYHNGVLIKYEFTKVTVGDLLRPNAVIIVTGNEEGFWPERASQLLYDDFGNIEFMIFETEN